MNDRRTNGLLTAIPLVYLAVSGWSASIDHPFLWGINHLRYYPTDVWLLCGLALVAVAFPAFQTSVLNIRLPGVTVAVSSGILVVAGAFLFLALGDRTHLLGDGHLLVRELDLGFRKIANEPFSLWLLNRALGMFRHFGVSASQIYSTWSILAGLLYLGLIPFLARKVVPARSTSIILVFLVVPAYTQLFFTYHEIYPVLYPLLLVYIWTGFEALNGRIPRWIPGLLLGLMTALHFTMITLTPSLLLLLGSSGRLIVRVKETVRHSWMLAPGAVIFLGLMWVTDFDFGGFQSHAADEALLPLFGDATHSIPYAVISSAHAIAFLNQQLLVFLPTLLLLPFVRRSYFVSRESHFLLSAAIPAWTATFLGYTVIGAFRDWDALAFPAVFVVPWMALGLIRAFDHERVKRIALVVGVTAGVHSLLWIGLNADSSRATERFEDALRYSHLSARARSYGWQTLGAYCVDVNALSRARVCYGRAIESDPTHPRYPGLLGFVLMQIGDYEGAADSFRKSIRLDGDRYEPRLNLGMALLKLNNPEEAIVVIQGALRLRPNLANILFALGVAHFAKGDHETAITAYLRVIEADPAYASAHLNLGQLYGMVGDNDRKRDHFTRVLSLRPDHPQMKEITRWVAWYEGQTGAEQR